MPRPFTRAQALENIAFLDALRETGNAREAARRIGEHRAKFTKRRASHPLFAAEWDAALTVAHAALHEAAVAQRTRKRGEKLPPPATAPSAAAEPKILRTASGRLQLRRTPAGRLTREGEQAFLAALSATANVRLAAAAAGFSHSAFYARRRTSPAFAREMRLALEEGYERIEAALFESFEPGTYRDDGWRHNDPPPIPPMTADQAITLLQLHTRTVRLWADRPDRARKRGENSALHSARLAAKWQAERAREMEDRSIAAAKLYEGTGRSRHEPAGPALPDLAQVQARKGRRGG